MHNQSAQRVLGAILRAGLAAPQTDSQLLEQFVRDRSAEAFAEIVRRHGALVHNVCRRVLGHQQDAEDAFQATFLVLARKARTALPLRSLGGWLFTVAFRTARAAKVQRRREAKRIAKFATSVQDDYSETAAPADWLPLLDEELNRLSERERLPIVLCDLLGRSRREAARELGLSEAMLSSRLARGRDRLRVRLERRGVVPAISVAGMLARIGPASATLIDSTLDASAALPTPAIASLADRVSRTMTLHAAARPLIAAACIVLLGGAGRQEPGAGVA